MIHTLPAEDLSTPKNITLPALTSILGLEADARVDLDRAGWDYKLYNDGYK